MANYAWSVDSSGDWNDPSNWGTTTVPTTADSVTIGIAGITVYVDTAGDAAYSLNVVNSSLEITAGSLYTVELGTFNGAYVQTGGTYLMSGYGANFFQAFSQTGGTIDVLSGAVSLYDGGTLAGTMTGTGALDVVSGSAQVNTGFHCTLSSIVVGAQGGKLGFDENFKYGGNLTLLNSGVLDLFGHTLTLLGRAQLDGVVGYGVLVETGTITLSAPQSQLVLDDGLSMKVAGTAEQDGNVQLGSGDAGARIDVAKTGIYDIAGDWTIGNPSSVGGITNSGLLEKTFGGRTAAIDVSFSSSGKIAVDSGLLLLDGLVNNIGGSVSGKGTLGIAGGQTTLGKKLALSVAAVDQQSGILVIDRPLTYGGTWDLLGGVLDLNTSAATLTLGGQTNLDGGTLTSFGGALVLNGNAHAGNVTIGGPTTIFVNGTLDQTGNVVFGLASNTYATIASTGSWLVEGDSSIIGSYGLITNNGLLSDPNGSGDAQVQASIINNGTISASNSTLTLAGFNQLGGTLAGNGLIDLTGGTILENGLAINVADLTVDNSTVALEGNLSFRNAFAEAGGNAQLLLNGSTFTLSGTASLDAGLIAGGTLISGGPTVIATVAVGGNATLEITGAAEQTGSLILAPSSGPGTLDIAAGGSYTFDDDVTIAGSSNTGTGTVIVAGTLTAASTGQSSISAIVDQTGLLQINDYMLTLGAGGSLAGTVSGSGILVLTGDGGAVQYNVGGLTLACAEWNVLGNAIVNFTASETFSGLFEETPGSRLILGGNTLTLSGTTDISGGTITGAGTVASSGSGTFADLTLSSGAVLSISGNAEENQSITVGQTGAAATLTILSGGVYTLDENCSILGVGTVNVAGTLVAAANGTSQIGDNIVDTGNILANLGTLQILSAVGGSGAFTIGATGELQITSSGSVTASTTVSFTSGGGELRLDGLTNFNGLLAGFAIGDTIQLAGISPSSASVNWNGSDTVATITDANHASISLVFTSAQDVNSISATTSANGLFELVHH